MALKYYSLSCSLFTINTKYVTSHPSILDAMLPVAYQRGQTAKTGDERRGRIREKGGRWDSRKWEEIDAIWLEMVEGVEAGRTGGRWKRVSFCSSSHITCPLLNYLQKFQVFLTFVISEFINSEQYHSRSTVERETERLNQILSSWFGKKLKSIVLNFDQGPSF